MDFRHSEEQLAFYKSVQELGRAGRRAGRARARCRGSFRPLCLGRGRRVRLPGPSDPRGVRRLRGRHRHDLPRARGAGRIRTRRGSRAVRRSAHHDRDGSDLACTAPRNRSASTSRSCARASAIGAMAITEPEAGSDAAAIKCAAPARRQRVGHQRLQDLHHERIDRRHGDRHRGDRSRSRAGPRRLRVHRRDRQPGLLASARTSTRWARARRRCPCCTSTTAAFPRMRCSGNEGVGVVAGRVRVLRLGAHGDDRVVHRRDEGVARCRRSRTRKSARPSASRSPSTRRSSTRSPR